MKSEIKSLGIIQESRNDESRAPLTPLHIKQIKEKYTNIEIIVPPSTLRCFSKTEYAEYGATISSNIEKCDICLWEKMHSPLFHSQCWDFYEIPAKY